MTKLVLNKEIELTSLDKKTLENAKKLIEKNISEIDFKIIDVSNYKVYTYKEMLSKTE